MKRRGFGRKVPSQIPSIFSRNNLNSMQLTRDFRNISFRFLRIKLTKNARKKLRYRFKGLVFKLVSAYRKWKGKKKKRFMRLFRRSKLLRFIKKRRRFHLIKLIKNKFKFAFLRTFARAYIKLNFVRRHLPARSFSKIVKLAALSRSCFRRFKHKYTTLYSLVLRQFLLRMYNFYLSKKFAFRVNVFKTLRFQFIFKFISLFFKKFYIFFVGFVTFTKAAFLIDSSFTFFSNKFLLLASPAMDISFEGAPTIVGLRPLFSRQNVRNFLSTKLTTLPTYSTFFGLTAVISKFSRTASVADQLLFFSTFSVNATFAVWARIAVKRAGSSSSRRTLVVSRLLGYAKPQRIFKKYFVRRLRLLNNKRFALSTPNFSTWSRALRAASIKPTLIGLKSLV